MSGSVVRRVTGLMLGFRWRTSPGVNLIPSDPWSRSSASGSPVLATEPLSQQSPSLFADIIKNSSPRANDTSNRSHDRTYSEARHFRVLRRRPTTPATPPRPTDPPSPASTALCNNTHSPYPASSNSHRRRAATPTAPRTAAPLFPLPARSPTPPRACRGSPPPRPGAPPASPPRPPRRPRSPRPSPAAAATCTGPCARAPSSSTPAHRRAAWSCPCPSTRCGRESSRPPPHSNSPWAARRRATRECRPRTSRGTSATPTSEAPAQRPTCAPPRSPEKIPHGHGAEGPGAADGEKILGSWPGPEDRMVGAGDAEGKADPRLPPRTAKGCPPARRRRRAPPWGRSSWPHASTATLVQPPPPTQRWRRARRRRGPGARGMPEALWPAGGGGGTVGRARGRWTRRRGRPCRRWCLTGGGGGRGIRFLTIYDVRRGNDVGYGDDGSKTPDNSRTRVVIKDRYEQEVR